jgi:hypothetical protein
VEVQLHALLTSELDGVEWSASRLGRFTPKQKAPGTRWRGSLMGPRAGLDSVAGRENLFSTGNGTPAVKPVAYIAGTVIHKSYFSFQNM